MRFGLRSWPPTGRQKGAPAILATLRGDAAQQLIFARAPISWQRWVAVWELDQAHGGTTQQVLAGISQLPTRSPTP
jgi:hypothetical protein